MTHWQANIRVGDSLPKSEIRITQELIDIYAEISGDFNPIHIDVVASQASTFGGTIAHGCIPIEPVFKSISQWLNSEEFSRNTAIQLRYRAPSRPGDVIRSEAKVSGIQQIKGRQLITIGFVCLNQRDERIIEGDCELTI